MHKIITFLTILALIIPLSCDESKILLPLSILDDYHDGEVTDMTPEAWEKLKFLRDWGTFGDRTEEIHKRQLAFYDRHIDADGVSIVGNSATKDFNFKNARLAFLLMTDKHPELFRKRLRKYYYIIIAGGTKDGTCVNLGSYNECWWYGQSDSDRRHINSIPERYSGRKNDDGSDRPTVPSNWFTISMFSTFDSERSKAGYITANSPYLGALVHELTHGIEILMGDAFREELEIAFENAKEKGLWAWTGAPHGYKIWDIAHFFTSVVDVWFFDIGTSRVGPDGAFGPFATPEDFIAYDPVMGKLMSELFNHYPFQDIFSAESTYHRENQ